MTRGGETAVPPDQGSRLFAGLAGLVITIHAILLIFSSWIHSPNPLEVNLLPAGYMHLKYGLFDVAQVNPPLSRTLMAVPLLGMDIKEDWRAVNHKPGSRSAYTVGAMFVESNRNSIRQIFGWARLVGVGFSIVAAGVIFVLAKDFYGSRAALVATLVWCFCPLVLGHAATVNHDVPGAAMLALAFLSFLGHWRQRGIFTPMICGMISGASVLTRTTNLPFVAAWMVISLLGFPKGIAAVSWQRRTGDILVMFLITLLTLNLGYEFQETLVPIGDYDFVSTSLTGKTSGEIGNRFRGSFIGNLPVPLPRDFVIGVDLQQRDFEAPEFSSYLCGKWRSQGWWYYYLFAWAIKTPIGFQIVFLLGTIGFLRNGFQGRVELEEVVMFSTIAAMFALASIKSGFTIHYRYIMPAVPFLALVCGRSWRCDVVAPRMQWCGLALLVYGVSSSMWYFPHSLSWFNEFTGGPGHGGEYLLHSSCDWGQDLYQVQDWLTEQENGPHELFVSCYGAMQPRPAGKGWRAIPTRELSSGRRSADEGEIKPGLYLISISRLYGEGGNYHYLKTLRPSGRIGYSVRIYDVRPADITERHWNEANPLPMSR